MTLRPLMWSLILGSCCLMAQGQQENPVLKQIKWTTGPATGALGGQAEVKIPAGYIFAGGDDTRKLLEAMQNPTSGGELGFLAPADLAWFVVFEYDDSGYVKDTDKDSLDANAMLASIRAGTEAGNKERQKRGWPTMKIVGWEQPPRYDATSHNLEWAIRGESEGEAVVNFNTRLLGRSGVMEVSLVVDPPLLAQTLPTFKSVLGGFSFTSGHKYSEFKAGDKIAKYGLTGLVVGGAAAVAAKAGVFKWLWKIILFGALAIGGVVKGLFGKKAS